jgi:hypothetical protein
MATKEEVKQGIRDDLNQDPDNPTRTISGQLWVGYNLNSPLQKMTPLIDSIVDRMYDGISGIETVNAFFNPTNGLPANPVLFDRYVATANGNGWIQHRLYEWDGTQWTETIPVEGYEVWDKNTDKFNFYNGSTWLDRLAAGITDHALLENLNSNNYYHLTYAQAVDLMDGGNTTLHYHASDRDRSTHSGTQTASTISDFATALVAVGDLLYSRLDHDHDGEYEPAITKGTTAQYFRGDMSLATMPTSLPNPYELTLGTGLTGTSYNGAAAVTAAVAYGTTAGTACQGNDSRLSDTRAPTAHGLVSATHTVSGLTTGHFLKAISATEFGFTAHGLTYTDVGAQPADNTLTALAGLNSNVGFIYQTGNDTFTKYTFDGTGSATTIARSDHDHSTVYAKLSSVFGGLTQNFIPYYTINETLNNSLLQNIPNGVKLGTVSTPTQSATPTKLSFDLTCSNGYTKDKCIIEFWNDGAGNIWGISTGPDYDMQFHASDVAHNGRFDYYVDDIKSVSINRYEIQTGINSGNTSSFTIGPNATYGEYLKIGGWTSTDFTSARMQVSNGNLHIDSKNGFDVYINHYNNKQVRIGKGIYFGQSADNLGIPNGIGVLSLKNSWGNGFNYPTLSGDGSVAIVMIDNPHVGYRSDNKAGNQTGYSGVRYAAAVNGSTWWETGVTVPSNDANNFYWHTAYCNGSTLVDMFAINNVGDASIGRNLTLSAAHMTTNTNYRTIRIGNSAVIMGQVAGLPSNYGSMWLSHNSYYSTDSGWHAMYDGVGSILSFADTGLEFNVAGSAVAGALHSHVVRFKVDMSGNIRMNSAAAYAWHSNYSFLDLRGYGAVYGTSNDMGFTGGTCYGHIGIQQNTYYDGANSRAIGTGNASLINLGQGHIDFMNASSVAAGAVQTFTSRLRITDTGFTGINNIAPAYTLDVNGTVNFVNARVKFIGGINYNENIRMYASDGGYSTIMFGAVAGDSGTGVGQWGLWRSPAALNYNFVFNYNGVDRVTIDTAGNVSAGRLLAHYESGSTGYNAGNLELRTTYDINTPGRYPLIGFHRAGQDAMSLVYTGGMNLAVRDHLSATLYNVLHTGNHGSTGNPHAQYEPAFTKNTAFNKNFGTSAGTVSEGNHSHMTTTGFTVTLRVGSTDYNSCQAVAARQGNLITFSCPGFSAITTVSGAMSIRGIPSDLVPSTSRTFLIEIWLNGASTYGYLDMESNNTYFTIRPAGGASFPAGSNGVIGFCVTYIYNSL